MCLFHELIVSFHLIHNQFSIQYRTVRYQFTIDDIVAPGNIMPRQQEWKTQCHGLVNIGIYWTQAIKLPCSYCSHTCDPQSGLNATNQFASGD